jgi:hypothetical protein
MKKISKKKARKKLLRSLPLSLQNLPQRAREFGGLSQ